MAVVADFKNSLSVKGGNVLRVQLIVEAF